ncbi:hypothetical protein BTR23_23490 [Alkalihalophilus pseudofirmus]|nr:hypothetical protein BTR23_23490 [Alkalihalophilus pseudofirmus]
METVIIEKIHEEFNDYYEGARLTGSYSLFAPFYKVSLKIDYIFETELNLLEQFIAKCIQSGVISINDISYVLGLSTEMVEHVVHHLEVNGYVQQVDRKLAFTENGLALVKKNLKREGEQKVVHIYYDGLTPQYKIEFFGKENEHQFLKYNRIPEDVKGNVILPQTFPQYDKGKDFISLSQRMLEYLNELDEEDKSNKPVKKAVTINEFSLENKREVLYHEYRILVFKREDGTHNLLAYDPCGDESVDQRVTQSLQQLYESGELNFGLTNDDEVAVDMHVIVEALKNYAVSTNNILSVADQEESIQKLETVAQNQDSSRYIMNYEIRKLFLHYLKNAQESLYIISPWMNSYIVNDTLIDDMTNLLKRGVKISIIYGIYDNDAEMDVRDRKTNELAEKLKKLGKKYNGLLTIQHGQTHEKLLICDGNYYINGSFNFLSYSGEQDGKFFRNEGSTYSEDRTLIEETIKLRFGAQA